MGGELRHGSSRPGERSGLVGSGPTTALLGVVVSTFFVGFGGGVVFPILPNLGSVLGLSPVVVGVVMSANRVSRIVAHAPAGGVVDRTGTRLPFVVGMGVQGVATVGYVLAMLVPIPEALFVGARLVWGVGSALVFAAGQTIAADLSDEESRGANMGIVRSGVILGFPAGLVLGGVSSDLAGPVAAFAVAACFAFTASALAYLTVPETHTGRSAPTAAGSRRLHTGPSTLVVGLVNFTLYLVYFGVLFATLVVFLDRTGLGAFGLGPQGSSGLFMALSVVTAGLGMYLVGSLSDRYRSRVPFVVWFLVVVAVGYALLASAGSVRALTVACACIGLGLGGASGPSLALLADLVPEYRMGRASGTVNLLGDVGAASGPLLAVPLAESVGLRPIYAACALLPLVTAAALLCGVSRLVGVDG